MLHLSRERQGECKTENGTGNGHALQHTHGIEYRNGG